MEFRKKAEDIEAVHLAQNVTGILLRSLLFVDKKIGRLSFSVTELPEWNFKSTKDIWTSEYELSSYLSHL